MADVLHRLLPGRSPVIPYPPGFTFPPPARRPGRKGRFGLGAHSETYPRWACACRTGLAKRAHGDAERAAGGVERQSRRRAGAVGARRRRPGLRAECDLLLDGGTAGGAASTVVDFSGYDGGYGYRILREGAVSDEQIEEMLTSKREDLQKP